MTQIKIRAWLIATLLLGTIVAAHARDAGERPFDIIIRNGRVVDGTGNPWWYADVGVRGARIAAVGDLSGRLARRVIDAQGAVIAPGFVDMHSHASWDYLVDSRAVSKLTQGVTLEIEGEGNSVAPMDEATVERLRPEFEQYGIKPDWRTLAEFFARLEAHPATINFATYIGTGTVRELAVGFDDRPARPEELDRMRAIVAQAMQEGALGVYSALMYSPDRYNRTEELIEMAKVAARYQGIYQTHPRSESDAFMESMDEVFRISREAHIPAHITHLKIAYHQNWGKMPQMLERIEEARAAGLDVTADMYPYERASGTFTALLPPWAQAGGRPSIVSRLKDPEIRARIERELESPSRQWENEYYGAGGGPAGITLINARGSALLKGFEGLTLAEIATRTNKDPRAALLDIVLAGDADLTVLIAQEGDIRMAMKKPWVAFGTDGNTVAPDGPLSTFSVHPRSYGTFARIFGTYVRELKLINLEDAVRRATSLPAQRLKIRDRGLLREGYYADIVVFDPLNIIDTATYQAPNQIAKGIHYVMVNGEVVLDEGKVTQARPGMVVRGPGYRPPTDIPGSDR